MESVRACKSAVFALVAFTLQALPVAAQDANPVEVTPYVALGSAGASPAGVTVTFPVTSTLSNGRPIGTEPRVALPVNTGGGLKTPMNEKLDLRTDARWFKSFGRQGSEQFRVAQGISFDVGKR
jgi:hypothetical protein